MRPWPGGSDPCSCCSRRGGGFSVVGDEHEHDFLLLDPFFFGGKTRPVIEHVWDVQLLVVLDSEERGCNVVLLLGIASTFVRDMPIKKEVINALLQVRFESGRLTR